MEKRELLVLIIIIIVFTTPLIMVINKNGNRDNILHARTTENGNWSKTEFKIKLGEVFTLSIISDDVVHTFVSPDFNISIELIPGQFVKIDLIPISVGTYQFYCDIICSPKHVLMVGIITVVE